MVINRVHGHQAGDRLLCLCADLVRETARGEDISARTGGDEFTIIMPDTALQRALLAAERIRSIIERDAGLILEGPSSERETTMVGEKLLSVTVSLGVATY